LAAGQSKAALELSSGGSTAEGMGHIDCDVASNSFKRGTSVGTLPGKDAKLARHTRGKTRDSVIAE
jgi:hypothetical protein